MDSSMITLVLVSLIACSLAEAVKEKRFTCLDCHTIQINFPSQMHQADVPSIVNCNSPDLPYCDINTGTCSATPTLSCEPKDTFPCLSDGYFPDPADCRAFHLCVNLTSTKYTCEPDHPTYTYDVVSRKCVQSSKCGYKCASKSGVKVAHPGDGNLYALCVNGTALFQERCPGNYELNESSQKCEAVCRRIGVQPDLSHCRSYFRCVLENGKLMKTNHRCDEGQAFNPMLMTCGNDLSFCN